MEKETMEKEPVKFVREKYEIQVNYSPEAIEKKLMKFVTPSGDEFEISAEEMYFPGMFAGAPGVI